MLWYTETLHAEIILNYHKDLLSLTVHISFACL